MNGAPCLIKQQCGGGGGGGGPEAHVELMGKSYIHPLDVDDDDDVFFCLRPPTPPLPSTRFPKSPLSEKGVFSF